MTGATLPVLGLWLLGNPALAAPPAPQTVVGAGVCSSLSMSIGFSPTTINSIPSSPNVSFGGSLTCAGLPVLNSASITLGGSSLAYSCDIGYVVMTGYLNGDLGTATIVQEGIDVTLTFIGSHTYATGNFVWSSASSIAACPLSGTSGSSLVGSLTYTSVS
ncbi:MAG: hypothetical protein ACYDGR_14450 [Candidatus Dormibacteria bacterium]